ncbi:MAG: family 78 glycoside hydrolase catalytic domain [Acidimicrobiia bacterium]
MQPPTLRSQLPVGMLGIGAAPVRLTWRVEDDGDQSQVAYEIQSSGSANFEELLASSGEIRGEEQIGVQGPGEPLKSREIRHYRARVATAAGWSDWSPVLTIEAGLNQASDWAAQAVTLPADPGSRRQSASPLLRHEFDLVADVKKARLYLTSLGIHMIAINGFPVTDELLNPGWSSYRHRLLSATYDVSDLLRTGSNVVSGVLGDGWYRGRLGWDPTNDRARYGIELGLIAQLEIELVDGSLLRVVTDEDWRASTGEIRSADLYDGSVIDLNDRQPGWDMPGFDASEWTRVAVVPFDKSLVRPRSAQAVRMVHTLPTQVVSQSGSKTIVDGGQNLAGFVRLKVKGDQGDQVTVRHAEVLEQDGTLHTRALRSAKATDTYTLADGGEVELEPTFTFHGFRYAEVETKAEIIAAAFVAISSDLPRRGWFECSDQTLNRLHENVVWSQQANFVSIPTDCPQRDERLGWTGDAQAFAPTACTLFEAQQFWSSWLEDLSLDQDDVLGVPSVVPDVVLEGEPRYGRAGWADAATFVPWAVYESYGDLEILRRQFDSMKRWVDSLQTRREPGGPLPMSMQFGDWLDPDAPSDRPWEAKADSTFLANAYFSRSSRLTAEAAELLGDTALSSQYRQLADEVAAAVWARWQDHVIETQTGCAVALSFDIVPEDARERLAEALADLVRQSEGRVATGFLGTPLVLHALAAAGHFDAAYQMLLRRQHPSWLYQVEMGATTVWERWDAIRPDGSIHPGDMAPPPGMEDQDGPQGHMRSFNHYAYGAVIDWIYRHLAGLAPDRIRPGYRHVILAPKPVTGIDWARASIDSDFGTTAISWQIEPDGSLAADVKIPPGASGTFLPPANDDSEVTLNGEPTARDVILGPGSHRLTVTNPMKASPEPS